MKTKSSLKKFTAFSMIIMLAIISTLFASAAEVNNVPANAGDVVTYELHVSSCPEKIQALDIAVYYDSNSLEYVPYSLELTGISGYMTNTDLTGEIRFNAIDFDGFVFDSDTTICTVQFNVIDTSANELSLSYEIKTFLDSNAIDLKDIYIYDYTAVNGRTDDSEQENSDLDTTSDSEALSETDSAESDSADGTDSEIFSERDIFDSDTAFVSSNIAENIHTDSASESNVTSESLPSNSEQGSSIYLSVLAVAAAVVLVIGIIFWIIAKRSNNGSHFS